MQAGRRYIKSIFDYKMKHSVNSYETLEYYTNSDSVTYSFPVEKANLVSDFPFYYKKS